MTGIVPYSYLLVYLFSNQPKYPYYESEPYGFFNRKIDLIREFIEYQSTVFVIVAVSTELFLITAIFPVCILFTLYYEEALVRLTTDTS